MKNGKYSTTQTKTLYLCLCELLKNIFVRSLMCTNSNSQLLSIWKSKYYNRTQEGNVDGSCLKKNFIPFHVQVQCYSLFLIVLILILFSVSILLFYPLLIYLLLLDDLFLHFNYLPLLFRYYLSCFYCCFWTQSILFSISKYIWKYKVCSIHCTYLCIDLDVNRFQNA